MSLIEQLQEDLDKGFSKSALERLIGLPQNSLAGIITGTKKISKISELKIQKWNQSKKPNPLDIIIPKKKSVAVQDLTGQTNKIEPKKPLGSQKSNYTLNTSFPPMPVKNVGENALDYAVRKNEWKLKYNK